MSQLQDFLNNNSIEEMIEEVPISERFKDKQGNYLKFKIANIPMDEYKDIQKACTKISKKGMAEFDSVSFSEKIVIKGTLDPNFKDAESIKSKGCNTPEQYLKKVLKTGEIIKLSERILILSGFDNSLEELIEEAKN